MTRDYYAEARDIATLLGREGLTSEAASLTSALDGGATTTEILLALHWNLDRIERLGVVNNAETRRRMADLSQAIRAALGQ